MPKEHDGYKHIGTCPQDANHFQCLVCGAVWRSMDSSPGIHDVPARHCGAEVLKAPPGTQPPKAQP